jgi:hypothetical protein
MCAQLADDDDQPKVNAHAMPVLFEDTRYKADRSGRWHIFGYVRRDLQNGWLDGARIVCFSIR